MSFYTTLGPTLITCCTSTTVLRATCWNESTDTRRSLCPSSLPANLSVPRSVLSRWSLSRRCVNLLPLPRPTQPPTLSGMGNEYRPKCGGALWLGSKGRYDSLHLWIKCVNLCDTTLTCAPPEHLKISVI